MICSTHKDSLTVRRGNWRALSQPMATIQEFLMVRQTDLAGGPVVKNSFTTPILWQTHSFEQTTAGNVAGILQT